MYSNVSILIFFPSMIYNPIHVKDSNIISLIFISSKNKMNCTLVQNIKKMNNLVNFTRATLVFLRA